MTKLCFICDNKIEKGQRKKILLCSACDSKISDDDQKKIKKLGFLKIFFIPYIQMIMYYGSKYRKPVELVNSGGEIELDRTSKRYNLIEGIILYILVQIAIWLCIGYLGESEGQLGIEFFDYVGYGIMVFGGIWAIFWSPFFHSDRFHGLGFPVPFEVNQYIKKIPKNKKNGLIIISIILILISIFMVLFNMDYTMHRMGIADSIIHDILVDSVTDIPTTAGFIFSIFGGIILFFGMAIFLIRWDNLTVVIKKILVIGVAVWGCIVLVGIGYAIILDDWSLFQNFQWISWESEDSFLPHIGFYAIWGLIQQWLFLGYFNTRLRKGLPNTRLGKSLTILITGLYFSLIHLPAWPLMIVTFLGGCFFGYYYQYDKYRNLFIMGVAHGVGATLVGLLTPMVMSVGPWAI